MKTAKPYMYTGREGIVFSVQWCSEQQEQWWYQVSLAGGNCPAFHCL